MAAETESTLTTTISVDLDVPAPLGEAQWVIIILQNIGLHPFKIKNVQLGWGKFHKDYQKEWEIPIGDIEDQFIRPKESFQVNSCGRSSSPSGTEGSFDIVDDRGSIICKIYWDSPWGSQKNKWELRRESPYWTVSSRGANLESGALGTVTVMVKFGDEGISGSGTEQGHV